LPEESNQNPEPERCDDALGQSHGHHKAMGLFLGGQKNRAGFVYDETGPIILRADEQSYCNNEFLQLETTCSWHNFLLKVRHKSKKLFLQVTPLLAFQYLAQRIKVFSYPSGENLRTLSKDRIPGFCRLKSQLHDTGSPLFDDELEIGCLLTWFNIPTHE